MTETPLTNHRRGRREFWIRAALILLALLLAVALLWTGLQWLLGPRDSVATPGGPRAADLAPTRLDSLTIFYTCDTSGQMEPCRCASGQTGGMSRRLGWLKSQQQAGPWLLVDAGDVTAGARDWELLEFMTILKGYSAGGYHAVNIGHRELALGRDRLRALRSSKVPFVSANVFDDSGALIFEPYRIVDIPKAGRAAIIGIVDTDYDPARLGPNLRVEAPAAALARHLPQLRDKADIIVLLAFAREPAIQALAEKFDALDVIVGGNTFQPTGDPLRFGKALVVLITDKGKAIGRLQLNAAGTAAPASTDPPSIAGASRWSARNEIVMLTENLPADPGFVKVYEDYKRQLVEMDFRTVPASADAATSGAFPRSPTADKYTGAESCRECHAKAWQVWTQSAHAHALDSLTRQNNHFNPRCLPCHVVGYGSTDGYLNPTLTPHLKNVQCESCHGRGEYHVKVSRNESIPARRTLLRRADCTACHDIVNSPGFEFDAFWQKIDHRE